MSAKPRARVRANALGNAVNGGEVLMVLARVSEDVPARTSLGLAWDGLVVVGGTVGIVAYVGVLMLGTRGVVVTAVTVVTVSAVVTVVSVAVVLGDFTDE